MRRGKYFDRFVEIAQHKTLTAEYESFIGFGKTEIISGIEAVKGLNLIAGMPDSKGLNPAVRNTRVYKKYTGKRRFLGETRKKQ